MNKKVESGLVQIQIVNYINWEATVKCIDSAKNQTYKNIRILVIENNSPNNSVEEIEKSSSDIIIKENSENLGWGGGLNSGLFFHPFFTEPEFVLTVNSDVILDAYCIERLVSSISTNKRIAVLTPLIYDFFKRSKVQKSGFNMSFRFLLPTEMYKFFGIKNAQKTGIRIVKWSEDAVSLMRREAIEAVGGYDERFFMYGQMTDLAYRLNKIGYILAIDNSAKAYHIGKGSSGEGFSEFATYHKLRNWILFHRKHFKGFWLYYLYLWSSIVAFGYTFLFVSRGRLDLIKPIFKGLQDGFSFRIKG